MITSRRSFIKIAGLSATGFMLGGCRITCLNTNAKKPNILFILTDDQGWADLSKPLDSAVPQACCKAFKTPNMNRFAVSGMRFTDAYSPAPICTPTRRSIQFGMTPARQNGTEFIGKFDPTGKWSIAQAIKKADPAYKCAHFGKWGGVMTGTWRDKDSQLPGSPDRVGYDESDGMEGVNEGGFYLNDWVVDKWNRNLDCEPFDDPKKSFSMTDKSIDFMQRQVKQNNPFYLQVSYHAIHLAAQARQQTIDEYKNAPKPDRKIVDSIAPMIDDLDENIGRLFQTIEDLGIEDNTYIFLTSDNGGEHWQIWGDDAPDKERNHPLRMYKQTLYEGGIRVPFAVKGPGIKPGSVCREPVAGYDLLPTFYEITGGSEPVPQKLDGVSLCSLLTGDSDQSLMRPDGGLIFHRPRPGYNVIEGMSSCIQEDYKLKVFFNEDGSIQMKELYNIVDDKNELHDLSDKMPQKIEEIIGKIFSVEGQSAYRQGNYKLMLFWTMDSKVKRTELYDLSHDIGENNDLSKQMPEKTAQLKKMLLDYLTKI